MFDSLADSVSLTLISLPLTPVMWLLAGVVIGLLLFVLGWSIRARISQQQTNTLIEIIQASEQRLSLLKTRLSNQRDARNETPLSGFNETPVSEFSDDMTLALSDHTIIDELPDTADRTQHAIDHLDATTAQDQLAQHTPRTDTANTQPVPQPVRHNNNNRRGDNPNHMTKPPQHSTDAVQGTLGQLPGQRQQDRRSTDHRPPADGIPVVGVKHDAVQVIRQSYEHTRRRHTEELITFRDSLKKLKQQYNTKLEDQARTLAFQEREAAAKIDALNHSLSMNKHKIVGLIAEVERHKSTIEDLTKVPLQGLLPETSSRPGVHSASDNVSDLQRQIDDLSSDNQGYQLEITRLKSELRSAQLQRDQLAKATQPLTAPLTPTSAPLSSLAAAKQPSAANPSTLDTSDDLKLVKGIGPVLEKALKRHGIHQFAQIAAFTDEDIDRIASLINTAAKRIHTEQWVSAAAALHWEKYHQEVT